MVTSVKNKSPVGLSLAKLLEKTSVSSIKSSSPIASLPKNMTSPSSPVLSSHESPALTRSLSDNEGWTVVIRRSKPVPPSNCEASSKQTIKHLSSTQFCDEEEAFAVAQRVLRNRSCSRPPVDSFPLSGSARKRAKKKQKN